MMIDKIQESVAKQLLMLVSTRSPVWEVEWVANVIIQTTIFINKNIKMKM